jgi:hypothetical protein
MLRSALAKAAPVISTVAAVIYTRERKGWAWAIPVGLAAHFATNWVVGQILQSVEALPTIPKESVVLEGQDVKVPTLENPVQFHGTEQVSGIYPVRAPRATEVLDKNDNVIKLPTAMGEP